jgi:putative hydrolase of the HAD superfamily
MRARIQCVIFDFGGVLSLPQDPTRAAVMAELAGLDIGRFRALYAVDRQELDRGSVDPDRYWTRIIEAGGVASSPTLIERLGREDCEAWTRINPPVHAWAEKLRAAGIATGILSNMPRYCLDFMSKGERFRWLSDFSPVIFSCDVGMVKPEPEIFSMYLSRAGFPSERCLFVDDVPANVEAARKAGIQAILYHSPEEVAKIISRTTNLKLDGLLG